MYIASGIVFIIFGTGEIQPWNVVNENKKQDIDDKDDNDNGVDNPAFDKKLENTKV